MSSSYDSVCLFDVYLSKLMGAAFSVIRILHLSPLLWHDPYSYSSIGDIFTCTDCSIVLCKVVSCSAICLSYNYVFFLYSAC